MNCRLIIQLNEKLNWREEASSNIEVVFKSGVIVHRNYLDTNQWKLEFCSMDSLLTRFFYKLPDLNNLLLSKYSCYTYDYRSLHKDNLQMLSSAHEFHYGFQTDYKAEQQILPQQNKHVLIQSNQVSLSHRKTRQPNQKGTEKYMANEKCRKKIHPILTAHIPLCPDVQEQNVDHWDQYQAHLLI